MIAVYLFAGGFMLRHLAFLASYLDGARGEGDRWRWLASRPLGTLEFMSRAGYVGFHLELAGSAMMVVYLFQAWLSYIESAR